MAGTLKIRITKAGGEIHDLRYRFLRSAWLEGKLVGKGHAPSKEAAEDQAMDVIVDQVAYQHVDDIEIDDRTQAPAAASR